MKGRYNVTLTPELAEKARAQMAGLSGTIEAALQAYLHGGIEVEGDSELAVRVEEIERRLERLEELARGDPYG